MYVTCLCNYIHFSLLLHMSNMWIYVIIHYKLQTKVNEPTFLNPRYDLYVYFFFFRIPWLNFWKFLYWWHFFFYLTIIMICVMGCVRPTSWLAGCLVWQKTLTLDIAHKLFNLFFFIPAMLIGTIDCYYFILLSLTMTLPWSHKVSTKQNLLASFSPTFFIWSERNFM